MYINLIQDMYKGLSASVKSMCGVTEDFNAGVVGVNQGSALSPYLFSVVMDEVTKEIPWSMIFTDDIILAGENLKKVNKRLDE